MKDTLAAGDHVRIVRGPWNGYTGTIVAPFGREGLDWTVEIDGMDHRTAQEERHLRKVPDGT